MRCLELGEQNPRVVESGTVRVGDLQRAVDLSIGRPLAAECPPNPAADAGLVNGKLQASGIEEVLARSAPVFLELLPAFEWSDEIGCGVT